MKSLILAALAAPSIALADPICADRPGAGDSVCVVSPKTFQVELGTDQQEARVGLFPHADLAVTNTGAGLKYNFYSGSRFAASIRTNWDSPSQAWSVEFPMQYSLNDKTSVSVDTQLFQHDIPMYSVSLSRNITPDVAVIPELAIQGKVKFVNSYVVWIPRNHQDLQFDLGVHSHRVLVGFSKRF